MSSFKAGGVAKGAGLIGGWRRKHIVFCRGSRRWEELSRELLAPCGWGKKNIRGKASAVLIWQACKKAAEDNRDSVNPRTE